MTAARRRGTLATVTRDVVLEHLAAFDAHDTERLLATLDDDVVWRTGTDVFTGVDVLRRDVFDDDLWSLAPSLTLDGVEQSFDIAVFFTVTDRITSVTVFREGSADLVR